MAEVVILADDLTGGADAGAAFAVAGWATSIAFRGTVAADSDGDVLVLCTNSREIEATAAADINRHAAETLMHRPGSPGPRWVYKKIDSALRGHPRDELLAVMAALGESRALVAPALPVEGRTTVGGRQFVHGSPLEGTSLGSSEHSSDLASLFGGQNTLPVQSLDLGIVRGGVEEIERVIDHVDSGLIVADAETDLDLLLIARAAVNSELRILVGSAGLARQLATVLPSPRPRERMERPHPPVGPLLIVAGSLHRATAAQVSTLKEAGLPVVHVRDTLLDDSSASLDEVVDALAVHLEGGRSAVLTTAGLMPSRLSSAFVASLLAGIVAAPRVRRQIGGLVLTGGETAASILSGIGATELRLMGEVRPAIPWGTLRSAWLSPMPVATKAGSFGESDALLACVEQLTGGSLR